MKRVVLITGVAGGIGYATAELFNAVGWTVIGVDRRESDDEMVAVQHFIQADIADIEASQQIFEEVKQKEGRLDTLVNNAAVQVAKPLVETTPEEWDRVMASNLRSVYLGVRHAYPLLKESRGTIINVSSVHAVATSANIAAYAASKGALSALTRALAIELTKDQIRVNAVLPGAVDTPMLRAGLRRGHLEGQDEYELVKALGARHVIGRVGEPREIAQAILFLADSERSSFITGQELVVDGGATIRLSTE